MKNILYVILLTTAISSADTGKTSVENFEKNLGLKKPSTPATGFKRRGLPGKTRSLVVGEPAKKRSVTTRSGKQFFLDRGFKWSGYGDAGARQKIDGIEVVKAGVIIEKKQLESSKVKPSKIEVYDDSKATLPILFKLDSTEIKADDVASHQNIATLAEVLKRNSDASFLLEGHSCDLGEADHNSRLSWARAESVKYILETYYGIAKGRVQCLGFGEQEVPPDIQGSEKNSHFESLRSTCRKVVVRQMVK